MNSIMFPASKNFDLNELEKSYLDSLNEKLALNKGMLVNLEAINGTELGYGWIENEMYELHLTIIDLEAELNMLNEGVFRC